MKETKLINNIFEQALLGILLKQVAVVELHQNLALAAKKNDLNTHIVCFVNLLAIVEGCNETELSDISSVSIRDYVMRGKMESLLTKTASTEE